MLQSLVLVTAIAAPLADAWGTLGHQTVAYIAQNLVSSTTESWARDILNDTSASYLANVSTWADSYRSTAAGSFSAPFHFIDAEDNPPASCSVDYARDCGTAGCVVSAIANYTNRVAEPSLSDQEVNYALRFIVHFVGDIHQPLHDEALALGGNDIDVTFDNTSTNLHHIWDTDMLEKLRGGYSLAVANAWAKELTTEIQSGDYKAQSTSWTKGLNVSDAIDTAVGWATQANAYVCSTVIPDGEAAVEATDLGTDYYASAVPAIEIQIARTGVRLAAWLDAIADPQSGKRKHGKTGKPHHSDFAGADLPPAPVEMSKAKLARAAVGWGCKH